MLRSGFLSGNLPGSVMVHNDVLLVARYTVARPHAGTVTRGTSSAVYIICFAIAYSISLRQFELQANFLLIFQSLPRPTLSQTNIACPYTRRTTTCLNAMLCLLEQFHSWSYQMGQMLH
jgi:hypothetical protein